MADLLLANGNIELGNEPTDDIPPVDRNDETSLDYEYLLGHLNETLTDSIKHKEYMHWGALRQYDLDSYYMQKDIALSRRPWPGASAYRAPLTATLLDTAWAYMDESVCPSGKRILGIKGIGREDIRTSKILESYMNNVIDSETNLREVHDQNIFRTFLNGTGIIKTLRNGETIKNYAIPVEDIYVPLYAPGFKIDETEFAHQMVALTKYDLDFRRASGAYSFDDGDIAPGLGFSTSRVKDINERTLDSISGQDASTESRNNLYYIIESYLTFYNKNSQRPLELKAWWVPNGNKILRVRKNEDLIRPFGRYTVYEYPGRFYGMSLPEKVREIQDKFDYSDKQYTDGLDLAARPAMFIDDTSSFDPDISQRVPGGIYPIGAGNKITFEPQPAVERGFDQERFNLWMQAERLTGLIDVVQGASTKSGRTLGETEMRQNSAGVRFNSLFTKYEKGFKQTANIIYQYQNLYVSRSKKVKLIGYEDYQTVGELFPHDAIDENSQTTEGLGIDPNINYNFGFSNKPISERDREDQDFNEYYEAAMLNPITASSPANLWRLLAEKAERCGVRNHDIIIQKPKEVNIFSAQNFIERVMSGQVNIQLRPGVDANDYILEINLFMQTDMFLDMDDRQKIALMRALQQAQIIWKMEQQALMDVHQLDAPMMQAQGQGQPQGNQQQPAGGQ